MAKILRLIWSSLRYSLCCKHRPASRSARPLPSWSEESLPPGSAMVVPDLTARNYEGCVGPDPSSTFVMLMGCWGSDVRNAIALDVFHCYMDPALNTHKGRAMIVERQCRLLGGEA